MRFAILIAVIMFPILLTPIFFVLLVPGRYLDVKKQVGLCEREATSAYPGQEFDTSAAMASYMIKCMEAESYMQNNSAAGCRLSDSRFETNPHCYLPSSWVLRAPFRTANYFRDLFGESPVTRFLAFPSGNRPE
jgi:hypothetical protein